MHDLIDDVNAGKKREREVADNKDAQLIPTKNKKTKGPSSPKTIKAVPKQEIDIDEVCVVMIGKDMIDLRLQTDIDQWIEKENNKPKKELAPKKFVT